MKNKNQEKIYSEEFVENLFNRMSKTYGITNYISSFGFTERWRKQCVKQILWNNKINEGYDFMSGMGETWGLIMNSMNGNVKINGVDISSKMNNRAKKKLDKKPNWKIKIIEENILANSIKTESADFIVSAFGLKTFSEEQLKILAQQTNRILKRGGQFSFVEISEPSRKILKGLYNFYLDKIIPIIGMLFMGNSLDYQMLGIYCKKFKNCIEFQKMLEIEGLEVRYKEYFYGCASGVIGFKK